MRTLKAGRQSKEELLNLFQEQEFEQMSIGTIRLVNTILHSDIPIHSDAGGFVNMCKAVREIREEISGYKSQIAQERERHKQRETELIRQMDEERKQGEAELIRQMDEERKQKEAELIRQMDEERKQKEAEYLQKEAELLQIIAELRK